MTKVNDLTNRQARVLDFVLDYLKNAHRPPTVREIAAHFGMSVNGAAGFLLALERKGMIERDENTSRNIRITNRGRRARRPERSKRP